MSPQKKKIKFNIEVQTSFWSYGNQREDSDAALIIQQQIKNLIETQGGYLELLGYQSSDNVRAKIF